MFREEKQSKLLEQRVEALESFLKKLSRFKKGKIKSVREKRG